MVIVVNVKHRYLNYWKLTWNSIPDEKRSSKPRIIRLSMVLKISINYNPQFNLLLADVSLIIFLLKQYLPVKQEVALCLGKRFPILPMPISRRENTQCPRIHYLINDKNKNIDIWYFTLYFKCIFTKSCCIFLCYLMIFNKRSCFEE